VLAEGRKVAAEVDRRAEAALKEHTLRRVWLAAFLLPILLVVVLLLLYIRTLPLPSPGDRRPSPPETSGGPKS